MPDEIKCSKCEFGPDYFHELCKKCNSENDNFQLSEEIKDEIMFISDGVLYEIYSAIKKYPFGFHSNHEAYGTILEELDELWDEIKAHKDVYEMTDKMRAECIQVAAMAIRFILDRYNKK